MEKYSLLAIVKPKSANILSVRQIIRSIFAFNFARAPAAPMDPRTYPKYTTLPSVPYSDLFSLNSGCIEVVPAAIMPMSIFMNKFMKNTQ